MKIAYFDCFSGISGDMTLGALLDLGLPLGDLLAELKKLPVDGYSIRSAREMRGAIAGTQIFIEETGHHHHARSWRDIRNMIESSGLDDPVKEKSLSIFQRIADAEARVHQIPVSEIHFHEVGALDSILDIVGTAAGLHLLGVEKVFASPVPLGSGTVKTHHGVLPVPAPATVLLLEGIPVYDNGSKREVTTPTGAGILAGLAEGFGAIPAMTPERVGYGVGSNQASDPPNLLRVILGQSAEPLRERNLLLLETHIDDMNPEIYPHVMEGLLTLGVLDVALVPIQMKKNRPGTLLRVLFDPGLQATVTDYLFRETTTLGVRLQEVKRLELPREERTVNTPFGPCRVKAVRGPGGEERLIPEFEECRRLAFERSLPLRTVYEGIAAVTGSAFFSEKEGTP